MKDTFSVDSAAFAGVALCALTLLVTSTSPVYAYTPRTFGGCTLITWALQPKVGD
jgi:hypothetical protein